MHSVVQVDPPTKIILFTHILHSKTKNTSVNYMIFIYIYDKMLTDYQLQNNRDFTYTCMSDTKKT